MNLSPFQTDSKHVTYKSLVFMMRANLKHLQFQISTKNLHKIFGDHPHHRNLATDLWICGEPNLRENFETHHLWGGQEEESRQGSQQAQETHRWSLWCLGLTQV